MDSINVKPCEAPNHIVSDLDNINVLLINACSVRNKTCMLKDLIIDNNVGICCITETWLHDTDTSVIAAFVPNSHEFYHFPRSERGMSSRGGGVGIVISKVLSGIRTSNRFFEYFECIELKFKHNNREIIICLIYKPPQINFRQFITEFEDLLMQISLYSADVFLMGDFNIHVDTVSNNSREFLNLLNTFGFMNYVEDATHGLGENEHILDLVITGAGSCLLKNLVVEPVATISDHKFIQFSLDIPVDKKVRKTIKFRNTRNLNSETFSNHIKEYFYNSFENALCTHESFGCHICVNCCNEIYRKHSTEYFISNAPMVRKTILIREDCDHWYNFEVREAKRKLRKAERNLYRRKTEECKIEYRRLRKIKCDSVRRNKISYYNNKISNCDNDSSKLYQIMNQLLGKNCSTTVLPSSSGDSSLATRFMEHFSSKVYNISISFQNTSLSEGTFLPEIPEILRGFDRFSPVDSSEVLKIMRTVNKTNCLNDPFDIRSIDAEKFFPNLSTIYSDLINLSFQTGEFPKSEKMAIVRPLLKAGKDPEQISSYRPLYNTSYFSKVLEKTCVLQLTKHLCSFESIPANQSAYRSHHSVETAICGIYDELIINKSSGNCTLVLLLDLTAAFDTVDHTMLLGDLRRFGVGGLVLQWFDSYLNERSFKVCIDENLSEECIMPTGVPQGSILGPILFTMYTVELSHLLKSINISCHFYADDTQLFFKISNIEETTIEVNRVFDCIKNWMDSRRLKLNVDKTECIIVGSTRSRCQNLANFTHLTLGEFRIKISESVRNLGVIFDKDLSFCDHMKRTKKQVIGNLINISRISKFLDISCRMKLVHGLVLSKIDYCNFIYYGLPNRDLRSLQLLINNAARIVCGMDRFSRERITPKCISLHILPLKARIEYKICLLAYKAIKYGQPSYLCTLLKPHEQARELPLRGERDGRLHEPVISRAAYSNRCFSYIAPRMYNNLPVELKTLTCLERFKNDLKTHLFRKSYDLHNKLVNEEYRVL